MNRLIQTFKGTYKMKKIEYKDVSRATDEKNQVAQFCRMDERELFVSILPLFK